MCCKNLPTAVWKRVFLANNNISSSYLIRTFCLIWLKVYCLALFKMFGETREIVLGALKQTIYDIPKLHRFAFMGD